MREHTHAAPVSDGVEGHDGIEGLRLGFDRSKLRELVTRCHVILALRNARRRMRVLIA
jgi:hypothetical protein